MNTLSKTLARIGLPDPASDIYLLLLGRGQKTISEIARSLNVHRPVIYQAVTLLQEKGLVELVLKGKQKYYAAEKPNRLQNLVSELSDTVESLMPDLENMMLRKSERPLIRVLEGKKGIGMVFDDVITSCAKGETFYRYTSELDLDKVNSYLPKDYRKRRDEKKLERQVISNRISGSLKKSRLERHIRYMPTGQNQFNQNAIQLIYANKIAMIDLNTETSIIIENETVAHFQKVIFQTLYKNLV